MGRPWYVHDWYVRPLHSIVIFVFSPQSVKSVHLKTKTTCSDDQVLPSPRTNIFRCASKGFDGSAPCGPIVPLDEVHIDATSVLSLGVNGSSRQQSKIGNMIWTIPEVVSYLSKYFRLMQGDLIFTGTPAGVGDLNIGDDISVACANLPGCKFVIGPPEKWIVPVSVQTKRCVFQKKITPWKVKVGYA